MTFYHIYDEADNIIHVIYKHGINDMGGTVVPGINSATGKME